MVFTEQDSCEEGDDQSSCYNPEDHSDSVWARKPLSGNFNLFGGHISANLSFVSEILTGVSILWEIGKMVVPSQKQ